MTTRPEPMDAADPLAPFRDRFVVDDELVAYLDGNSLGRLPQQTADRLAALVRDEWGARLIRGWEESWVDLPVDVGDELAAALLGAAAGQTVIADSTSVCIYKLLHAACGIRPGRDEIVIDATNFPTDRYLVESVAAGRGMTVRWLEPDLVENVTVDVLAGALGERTAVVVLSHVDYRSGALLDLPVLTELVHGAGGVVLWDLCHSVGVLPIDLDAAAVDFAVGCTYKYVNGGPGAPAFMYVAARHLSTATQPITGWWSAADLFAMSDAYEVAPSIRRMLSGTPSVPGIVAVREGVRLIAEAGVEAIRTKSELLTAYAIELLDQAGLDIVTPREPGLRGSHVTVRHAEARRVATGMLRRGVVPDFREPDLIRLGLSPLTTSYAEVAAGIAVLAELARE